MAINHFIHLISIKNYLSQITHTHIYNTLYDRRMIFINAHAHNSTTHRNTQKHTFRIE